MRGKTVTIKASVFLKVVTFYTKITTTDTDGDLYVYESTRLKDRGPALHYYYEQDEFWYVLKGESLIKIGEETYHAKEGDLCICPKKNTSCFCKSW